MITTINFENLTTAQFLSEYWQKKPLLIKNGFQHFDDPISADELAGLAMEDCVESRIVSRKENKWDVTHGPFSDFDKLGDKGWTLLVQAVNNWSASVNNLIKPFNFIPQWRIDDVMVSFSTPQGGVGPHLDQYDVFIIQGMGTRHWRVGSYSPNHEVLCPHPDLKQIVPFDAVIDVITEVGDILYIPPGHPHDGVAIENALNYSIGFQAPKAQELISCFADYILDNELFTERFTDPNRPTNTANTMSAQDFTNLVTFFSKAATNEAELSLFLGQYLTKNHHELDILTPEEELTFDDVSELCLENELTKVLGLKVVTLPNQNTLLFVNGEIIETTGVDNQLIDSLLSQDALTIKQLKSFIGSLPNVELLTRLINSGYWYFE